MHLHDWRKGAVLCPACEKIGVVGCEICILISADVVAPDRKPAHRGGVAGGNYALQSVSLRVIRLIISGPAGRERTGAVEAAAGEEDSILAKDAGNGFVVLDAIAILHFQGGPASSVGSRRRNVWGGIVEVYRFAVIGFETANGGFER